VAFVQSSATVGERVALHRRRRGLSQAELARLLGRSPSWLEQVERGVRSVDRASVLGQIAAVLRVSVSELAPGSLIAEEREVEPAAVQALRTALTGYPSLSRGADVRPFNPTQRAALRYAVDEAWKLVHEGRQTALADALPGLLERADLVRASWTRSDDRTGLTLAAETYQVTTAVLTQLGQTALAWIAADRAIVVAQMAGDRLQTAAGTFRLAHVFLAGDRLGEALQVASGYAEALEPRLGNASTELISLWGALHLVAAVAATKRQERARALTHLEQAESAAARTGAGRNDGHTEFSPVNVALHGVTVYVELGDPGTALRRADAIDVAALSLERRVQMLVDVARACTQLRLTSPATRALLDAEDLGPELVRSQGLVREVVRELMAVDRGAELQALAKRLGMQR
jgi:transcriptional regulator with XRE-family HTH domain